MGVANRHRNKHAIIIVLVFIDCASVILEEFVHLFEHRLCTLHSTVLKMAENSTAGTYSIAFVTIKDMPSAQILAQYVLKLQIQMT